MKFKFDTDYKTSKTLHFPSDNISQELKDRPEYFRQCASTILHKYVNNKCWLPYTDVVDGYSVSTLRAYAAGRNSSDKYKDIIIGPRDGRTGKRPKTTVNISWDTVKILPQKLDVVLGYFMKMEWDIDTSAVDYQSNASKQAILATMKLSTSDKYKLMREEVNAAMGSPIAQMPEMPDGAVQGSPLEFRSEKEVDMFASMGGVFLEQEAAISNLLDKSKEASGWKGVSAKHTKDLVTLGVCASRVKTNKDGTIVESEYVDPEMMIIPNSKFEDFRDMSWGGEIQRLSIATLRETSKLSDEELLDIAKRYATVDGSMPSGFYYQAQQFFRNEGFDQNMMNQITVDVVDCRWIGTIEDTYTSVNRKGGEGFRFNQIRGNVKLNGRDLRDGKEVKTYSRQVIYKCKMIVGTNYVFDYGIDEFLSYKKDLNGGMRVVFPYRVQRTETSSLVERCISFVDDINLSQMKLRVAKKAMPTPPGFIVKKAPLENVNINGVSYSPQMLLKMLQDDGILIVDDQTPWGTQNTSSRAIEPIDSNVIRQLMEWRADIEWNINMISIVTGINEVFSAQSPTAETGLGVSRMAIEATANALYPIAFAKEEMEKGMFGCMKAKWQVVSKFIPEKERERLAINRALQYIKISTNLDEYDFDVRLEVAPNEDARLMLLQDIARMRDLRRQAGTGGILPSDYFLIWSMVNSGKIKQAQLVLAQIEELRAEEDERKRQAIVQENMQSQMMSNQQTAENQSQLQQQDHELNLQSQIEVERAKSAFKIEENRAKSEEDRKTAAVQNLWGWSSEAYSKKNK
ncbi:hypothetical protein [Sphingobacterium detergens]|uniref:hypothetical protein n=1 Tax=Sphingobacterium detergens TaxID=1145106 RepID=UPI003AAABC00